MAAEEPRRRKTSPRRVSRNVLMQLRRHGPGDKVIKYAINNAASYALDEIGFTGKEHRAVRAAVLEGMQRGHIAVNSVGGAGNATFANVKPLVKAILAIKLAGGTETAKKFQTAFMRRANELADAEDTHKLFRKLPPERVGKKRTPTAREGRLIQLGVAGPSPEKLRRVVERGVDRGAARMEGLEGEERKTMGDRLTYEDMARNFRMATSGALMAAGFDPTVKGDATVRRKLYRIMREAAEHSTRMQLGRMDGLDVAESEAKYVDAVRKARRIVKDSKGLKARDRFDNAFKAHSTAINRLQKSVFRARQERKGQ